MKDTQGDEIQQYISSGRDVWSVVKGRSILQFLTGRLSHYAVYPLDVKREEYLFISSKYYCFDYENGECSRNVRVLAIVHCYNEADIIRSTIQYLIDQGIDVYLVDNWSNDGSFQIAEDYKKQYNDKLYIERFPKQDASDDYIWYDQLKRTEEISREMNYDWFIHYDADEIRISPWKNVNLRDAISYIDYLGFNAIENTVIDFRMVDKDDHIYPDGKFFDFRYKPYWINHLKTWKKNDDIDLKSTGGHYARFKHPKIFPLHFLNKHYPLRSLEQAEKKVFTDRKPRFEAEKSRRGWHGQYDSINTTEDFIFPKEALFEWNEDTFENYYFQLFMEAGLRWDKDNRKWSIPEIKDRSILLYGAGNAGRYAYEMLSKNNRITQWVDRNYEYYPNIFCREIQSPDQIKFDYDTIAVIAVINKDAQLEISKKLLSLGMKSDKFFYLSDI